MREWKLNTILVMLMVLIYGNMGGFNSFQQESDTPSEQEVVTTVSEEDETEEDKEKRVGVVNGEGYDKEQAPLEDRMMDTEFEALGNTFQMAEYNGYGKVGSRYNILYRWDIEDTHYLGNQYTEVGHTIRELGVGDTFTLGEEEYEVMKVYKGMADAKKVLGLIQSKEYSVSLQTDEEESRTNIMRVVFADKVK